MEKPSKDQLVERLNAQADAIDQLTRQNKQLQKQLDWFKRQLFGRKSEVRQEVSPHQQAFDSFFPDAAKKTEEPPSVTVTSHQRRKKNPFDGTPEDSGLRFDESRVPVQEIEVLPEELKGLKKIEYDIIRYEHTYRLAQRPGSYLVLKYSRPVIKHKATSTMKTTPAPESCFGKSLADVSLVAGMLVDKFQYHLPLYRQHQRLLASHIILSRSTLTHLVERAALLLKPIADAVLESILKGDVLAMDETPVKAGRKKQKDQKHGKMKSGWYWPIYGNHKEIYFHFSPSRGSEVVKNLLKDFKGTLLTDGYAAYASFVAAMQDIIHALCWSHGRRSVEKSLDDEPELAHEALDLIGAIYADEDVIKEKNLKNEEKLKYRQKHIKPIVDRIFEWCTEHIDRPDLVASESPILDAIRYLLKREAGLRVFLSDPDVDPDTNHLEREIRRVACGKKNWLFCWTELGAHYVGIIQTLMASCKLQDIDPHEYLVDVMQRVDRHPAKDVHELIPRVWKEKFGDKPLKSDINAL